MTLSHAGSVTLGSAVPLAVQATAAADASIAVALPSIQAKVAGLVALSARLGLQPPSLAASLSSALQLVTSLQAAASLSLPSVDFQVAAVAKALAEVQATLGELQAQLALVASLNATLGTSGIHLYRLSGRPPALGAELAAAWSTGLPGGTPVDDAEGVVLIATSNQARTALKVAFG